MDNEKRPYTAEHEQAIKMIVESATDAELQDGAWFVKQYRLIAGDDRSPNALAWRVRQLTLNTALEERGRVARRALDVERNRMISEGQDGGTAHRKGKPTTLAAPITNASEDGSTMETTTPRGAVVSVMAPWKVAEVLGVMSADHTGELSRLSRRFDVRRILCANPRAHKPILAWPVSEVNRVARLRRQSSTAPAPAPAPAPIAKAAPPVRQLEIPVAAQPKSSALNGHTDAARRLIVKMMADGLLTPAQAVAMLAETA